MNKIARATIAGLQAAAVAVAFVSIAPTGGFGHESGGFGRQGDAKKVSRTVHVVMREDGNRMFYVPDFIEVKKGEQIRFVIDNEGLFNHEFVLGTERSITRHAAEMRKNPDMEHYDAHSLRVAPYTSGELLWRFTEPGRFAFGCLIPGHLERGMKGNILTR